MPQTLHIVRHAQGYHQLPLDHPDTTQRDPELTTYGIEQAVHFSQSFPHHGEIDLLCASPMKRTIRTALVAFEQDVTAGRHIVLLPDAQEATADASDTGSEVAELQRVFGDVIDVRLVEGKWYEKAGAQAIELGALRARAARLRKWLRSQEKESVVLVTHGLFAHYLTGNIQDDGGQTGPWWTNVRWRSFHFSDDEQASLVETEESKRRIEKGEAPEHPPEGEEEKKQAS